jgi:hypothetical protein
MLEKLLVSISERLDGKKWRSERRFLLKKERKALKKLVVTIK